LLLSHGTLAAIALVALWNRRTLSSSTRPWWVVPLFLGGAISNSVDRLASGAVRDFVPTPWLAFNLADVAILIAVAAFYRDLASRRHRNEVTP
jgi:lipoprotein signal peptidase